MSIAASKTAHTVLSELKMMLTGFRGAFLLVEGNADIRFWKGRTRYGATRIVDCGGKPTAKAAARMATGQGLKFILAVVDRDFEHFFPEATQCDSILTTDTHDIETMMLSSQALPNVLSVYADLDAVYSISILDRFADLVLERALLLGKLRYISYVNIHNVDFDKLSPYKFIDATSWTLDVDALVAAYCTLAKVDRHQVDSLIHKTPSTPAWQLVNGHDCIAIVNIAFKGVIRARHTKQFDLDASLRLAYNEGFFSESLLYRDIKAWEKVHCPILTS